MDAKLSLSLEARRQREAERLARIKDPQAYKRAVDPAELARQVAEKQQIRQTEADFAATADAERIAVDNQLVQLEEERRRAERKHLAELDTYRSTLQGRATSRDHDLSDPTALRREQPGRVSDDDERLGASSMQKFHGEDLAISHRVKGQQEELRSWFGEAVREKEAAQAEAAQSDTDFSSSMLQIDGLKSSLEASAQAKRREAYSAVAEYNLAQARAKKERERAAQAAEVRDNLAEIENNLSSTLLNEDPSVSRSYISPNRVRPDHFKGFSADEHQAILQQQAEQATERQEAEAEERAWSSQVAEEIEHMRQVRCSTEAQLEAKRAEMRRVFAEENRQLAETQKSNQSFLDSVVYPNQVSEHFFSFFNTTSR